MKFLERLKFEFTINTLFIGIFILIIGGGVTSYWLSRVDPYEAPTGVLPVPIQVGKNKIIVSKTGDASMRTEYNRRKAIIGSNSCGISPKFSFSGSTNGSLETYFLSSICPSFVKDYPIPTTIEGIISSITGNSTGTGVLDGGGANVDNKTSVFADAGGAKTDYTNSSNIDFGSAK
jgi:hypothetical protein